MKRKSEEVFVWHLHSTQSPHNCTDPVVEGKEKKALVMALVPRALRGLAGSYGKLGQDLVSKADCSHKAAGGAKLDLRDPDGSHGPSGERLNQSPFGGEYLILRPLPNSLKIYLDSPHLAGF